VVARWGFETGNESPLISWLEVERFVTGKVTLGDVDEMGFGTGNREVGD
jgi:hypothetical protein